MREHLISVVARSYTTHRVLTHLIIYTNEINYKLYVYKPNEYINQRRCALLTTPIYIYVKHKMYTCLGPRSENVTYEVHEATRSTCVGFVSSALNMNLRV